MSQKNVKQRIFEKKINLVQLRKRLIGWGEKNYQDYIWRSESDPEKLIIAEFLLQRTRASQVKSVFETFIQKFPTISSIHGGAAKEIRESLNPLGLRWRVEKLMDMATAVVEKYDGVLPQNKAELMALPGVGDYISSAIMSFIWKEPVPIIDGNVVRIMSRIFDLQVNDGLRRKKGFRKELEKIIDKDRPDLFNYALLDLSHLLCTTKNPLCSECPLLQTPCEWGKKQVQSNSSLST